MSDTLEGKLLIAMPQMLDDNFARTVVLMCLHSDEGAMGLIINRLSRTIDFDTLAAQIDLLDTGASADEADVDDTDDTGATGDDDPMGGPGPARASRAQMQTFPVHTGGPVEPSRGFVLHSPDFLCQGASVRVAQNIYLTATVEMLKAMAEGRGPKHAFLALGYAAWDAGQLEREIQANGWLHTDASAKLVFETPLDQIYDGALGALGIDPSFLVTGAGHA